MKIQHSHLVFLIVGLVTGTVFVDDRLSRDVYAAKAPAAVGQKQAAASHYYHAGTEQLATDEMRVTALGTGTPNIQHRQASSCWLVELGNDDTFLFDVGTGCAANLAALNVSWGNFDKIFLSHLHSDHFGDLGALYVAGNLMGRLTPLHIWGPSGRAPEFGTKAAVGHVVDSYAWDKRSRQGKIPVTGMETVVTEFDYSKTQTVYDKNGVIVRAWPAIHALDGPVSFSLEWADLKFVFSGDTSPNKWFTDNAQAADILIYDCFTSVSSLLSERRYTPAAAWIVGTRVHTSPQAAGKVFSMLEPRMAVCYHFINDTLTLPGHLQAVRSTYGGPLTIAEDMLVWNVTKSRINTRKLIGVDSAFAGEDGQPADRSLNVPASKWLLDGTLALPEVDRLILEQIDPVNRELIKQTVPAHMLPGEN